MLLFRRCDGHNLRKYLSEFCLDYTLKKENQLFRGALKNNCSEKLIQNICDGDTFTKIFAKYLRAAFS